MVESLMTTSVTNGSAFHRKPLAIRVVTNLYPNAEDRTYGTFVAEQVRALRRHPKIGRVDVQFINGRRGKRAYASAYWELRSALANTAYDLLHAHHGLAGAVATLAAGRTPTVVTFHGSDLAYYPLQRFISRRAADRAAGCICVAESLLAHLDKSAFCIPCGVETVEFRPLPRADARSAFGVPKNAVAVLFPGRRTRRQKRYDRFRLVCDAMEREGANPFELVLEEIPRATVPELMAAADVLVMTSESEGSPVTLLEALACGLPIVATDVGGVRMLLGSATGTHVGPFDATDFAQNALRLGRTEAGRSTHPRSEEFSNARIAERIVHVYGQVLDDVARD